MDNAPCHPPDIQLTNVKLQFFPPNTTSIVQPLDQGVIHSFKAHSRKSFVKHIIASSSFVQTASDIAITPLDAVYWIDLAWKSVTYTTIQNTFAAAGFKEKLPETSLDKMTSNTTIDETMQVLDDLLKHIIVGGSTMTTTEFINLDDHASTFNEWNDDCEKLVIIDDSRIHELEDEEDEKDGNESPPKLGEALEMIQRLHLYSNAQCPQLHQAINEIELKLTDIYFDSKVSFQSTLYSYFAND